MVLLVGEGGLEAAKDVDDFRFEERRVGNMECFKFGEFVTIVIFKVLGMVFVVDLCDLGMLDILQVHELVYVYVSKLDL